MTIEDLIKNPELIEKLRIKNPPNYEAERDKFFEEFGEIIERHPLVPLQHDQIPD